ncbi:hypothetical protein MC7420_8321 [Coleofasciculus chthonoplastes PCC 7420]|uniref:Uncharacterized protein n=1 Tax=Coleofasciculus chthonoplastes PCC 7420 TaxID=118168 RepID=B4W0P9_9CYAN|nr:hypothetical protein MC7420_8321 [Coleofasciculus chthonoplastes PCC 7420]
MVKLTELYQNFPDFFQNLSVLTISCWSKILTYQRIRLENKKHSF